MPSCHPNNNVKALKEKFSLTDWCHCPGLIFSYLLLSPDGGPCVPALWRQYPTACIIYQCCVVSGRGSEGPVFTKRRTRWQCVRQRKRHWGYRKPYQLPSKTTTMSTLMLHQSDIQFYWHYCYILFYAPHHQSGGIKQSCCPSICPSVCLSPKLLCKCGMMHILMDADQSRWRPHVICWFWTQIWSCSSTSPCHTSSTVVVNEECW